MRRGERRKLENECTQGRPEAVADSEEESRECTYARELDDERGGESGEIRERRRVRE